MWLPVNLLANTLLVYAPWGFARNYPRNISFMGIPSNQQTIVFGVFVEYVHHFLVPSQFGIMILDWQLKVGTVGPGSGTKFAKRVCVGYLSQPLDGDQKCWKNPLSSGGWWRVRFAQNRGLMRIVPIHCRQTQFPPLYIWGAGSNPVIDAVL